MSPDCSDTQSVSWPIFRHPDALARFPDNTADAVAAEEVYRIAPRRPSGRTPRSSKRSILAVYRRRPLRGARDVALVLSVASLAEASDRAPGALEMSCAIVGLLSPSRRVSAPIAPRRYPRSGPASGAASPRSSSALAPRWSSPPRSSTWRRCPRTGSRRPSRRALPSSAAAGSSRSRARGSHGAAASPSTASPSSAR